jgi:hypothetical protein
MPLPTSFALQQASIQEQDRSKTIEIATWALFGTIVTIFVARQVMKAFVFRKVALDDFFMLAATVGRWFYHQNYTADATRFSPLGFQSRLYCWLGKASELQIP